MSTTLDAPASAGPAVQLPRDPLVSLLERIERHSNTVPEESRGMSEDIAKLLEQARQPGVTRDPEFRTQVAYLLQDWPKFSGSGMTIVLSPALEAELPKLAMAYPGLESTRMQALVASTRNLKDRELIGDIRAAAAEVAGLGGGHRQLGILVSEAAKVLEHRVTQSSLRSADPSQGPRTSASPSEQPVPDAPAVARTATSQAVETAPPVAPAQEVHAASSPPRQAPDGQSAPPSPRFKREHDEGPTPTAPASPPASTAPASARATTAAGPAATVATATAATTGILAGRVGMLGRRLAEDKVKSATEVVLRAGTAAVDAMDTFLTGPGREFSNKLAAAARHEAGGVPDVIAEMTPQGRHSGLHREFNDKLKSDPAFAAGHEEVVKAADRYFRKRIQAQETARDKGIDYSAADTEAQKADAKIGETVSHLPGREAGKSMLQEIGNRAVELYNAAVQGLKALLGRDAGPESRPRPGPSPG